MSCNEGYFCANCCSSKNIEKHHAVHRKENRMLIHCKLNYVYLCKRCHSFLHSKRGKDLDKKVKLVFLNRIEQRFLKEYINFKEIKEVLGISDTATHKLTDCLVRYKEGFKREDLIRICMGDGFYE